MRPAFPTRRSSQRTLAPPPRRVPVSEVMAYGTNNSRPGPAVSPSELLAQMRANAATPPPARPAAERYGVGSLEPMTTNNSRPGVARSARATLAEMRQFDAPPPRPSPQPPKRVGPMTPLVTNNSHPDVARPLDVPVSPARRPSPPRYLEGPDNPVDPVILLLRYLTRVR
jgi:hypothetical protein